MKKIEFKCDDLPMVKIDDLKEFQGNLKELSKKNYEKLKGEILETGFAFAFNVWADISGDIYVISGHQRLRTLKKLREEGYEITHVPCVFIKAKDRKEAKRRVLQDASSYGEVSKDGLYEYLDQSGMSLDDLDSFRLPDIEVEDFKVEFGPELDPVNNEPEEQTDDTAMCPQCGFKL